MSREEIAEIVEKFRNEVCEISDEEVKEVVRLCERKIEITGQPKDYMKLLLPDELRNHIFRRAVNATTILRNMEKEGIICVQCVGAIHA